MLRKLDEQLHEKLRNEIRDNFSDTGFTITELYDYLRKKYGKPIFRSTLYRHIKDHSDSFVRKKEVTAQGRRYYWGNPDEACRQILINEILENQEVVQETFLLARELATLDLEGKAREKRLKDLDKTWEDFWRSIYKDLREGGLNDLADKKERELNEALAEIKLFNAEYDQVLPGDKTAILEKWKRKILLKKLTKLKKKLSGGRALKVGRKDQRKSLKYSRRST